MSNMSKKLVLFLSPSHPGLFQNEGGVFGDAEIRAFDSGNTSGSPGLIAGLLHCFLL